MASINLADATTLTGATTGQVLCGGYIVIPSLSGAQKSALGTFVTSLGSAWPGNPNHVVSIGISRLAGPGNVITCQMEGVMVHANATNAVTALTNKTVTDILGIV